ncbi:MAG TPA: hypothetical protein VLA76_07445 [Candidatus Angelobacter sp.]|nr:hypothetical protein [Candidatus Angelobacter sp.]
MNDHDRPDREDVDPADALGGAAALPLPEGQPRGAVPTDRDAPGTDVAPEAIDPDERPDEG